MEVWTPDDDWCPLAPWSVITDQDNEVWANIHSLRAVVVELCSGGQISYMTREVMGHGW